MTQAMPPAQPVSFGAVSTPGSARKSESPEDFSDTLRDQIEGKPREQSAEGTSTSQVQPGQEQVAEDNDVTGAKLDGTQNAVAVSEPGLPAAQPLAVQQADVAPASLESLSPASELAEPSAALELEVSNTQPASAVVASVAVGKTPAAPNPAAASGDGAKRNISIVPSTDSVTARAADNAMLLPGVARVTEVVTPAPAQLVAILPPALAASAAGAPGSLPSPALPLAVDTPLASPGWGTAMAARVVWGATQGMQSVSIEINPRDLGPVSVNLRVVGEQASITFVSQHALVREAVEAALPRLRELFSGDGINLGEVEISNGEGRPGGGGDAASADDEHSNARRGSHANTSVASSSGEASSVLLNSLVDTFA